METAMSDPTYYYLADVEQRLAVSRDTLNRLVKFGVLAADGQGKQRRAAEAQEFELVLWRAAEIEMHARERRNKNE
jgi:hypothetical protein